MCFQIFSSFPFLCVLNPLSLILLCVLDPTISPPPASDIARMHPAQKISFCLHTFLCKSLRAPDIDPYYGSIPYFLNTFSLLCVVDPLSFYPSPILQLCLPSLPFYFPFSFAPLFNHLFGKEIPPRNPKNPFYFQPVFLLCSPCFFSCISLLLVQSFTWERRKVHHLMHSKASLFNSFPPIKNRFVSNFFHSFLGWSKPLPLQIFSF